MRLKGIELQDEALRIGALETHASIAESPLVRDRLPALASLAVRIGDQMVRNRGTLGGAIANNDPLGDYPAAALGLGADDPDRAQVDHRGRVLPRRVHDRARAR